MSPSEAAHFTANDRFKQAFTSWFWIGLILATLAHALLFYTAPTFGIEDITYGSADLRTFDLPDEIQIPPPPAAVPRPAAPVIVASASDVESELTIPRTTLDANPAEALPAPPAVRDKKELADAPVFTPMTVHPELLNAGEITEALLRLYPPLLRDAGIGGRVQVWFFIDGTGHVVKTQLHQSSGFDAFDEAALRIADLMEFSPAYNRDDRVPVWVSIPIVFEVGPGSRP